jgi:hypothetical protein
MITACAHRMYSTVTYKVKASKKQVKARKHACKQTQENFSLWNNALPPPAQIQYKCLTCKFASLVVLLKRIAFVSV